MAVMIASKTYTKSVYAFVYGYARRDIREKSKKIYSIVAFHPLIVILFLIIVLLLLLLKKKRMFNILDDNKN